MCERLCISFRTLDRSLVRRNSKKSNAGKANTRSYKTSLNPCVPDGFIILKHIGASLVGWSGKTPGVGAGAGAGASIIVSISIPKIFVSKFFHT
jgi:hypothetical protein